MSRKEIFEILKDEYGRYLEINIETNYSTLSLLTFNEQKIVLIKDKFYIDFMYREISYYMLNSMLKGKREYILTLPSKVYENRFAEPINVIHPEIAIKNITDKELQDSEILEALMEVRNKVKGGSDWFVEELDSRIKTSHEEFYLNYL